MSFLVSSWLLPTRVFAEMTLLAPESPRFRENVAESLMRGMIAAGPALRGYVWHPGIHISWALFRRGRSFLYCMAPAGPVSYSPICV